MGDNGLGVGCCDRVVGMNGGCWGGRWCRWMAWFVVGSSWGCGRLLPGDDALLVARCVCVRRGWQVLFWLGWVFWAFLKLFTYRTIWIE